jgi:hypothetical protein
MEGYFLLSLMQNSIRLLNCILEIGANAIRIASVVVVRITIAVRISKIRRRNRKYPFIKYFNYLI